MACTSCQRRKLVCDGLQPTCSSCGRANRVCKYILCLRQGGSTSPAGTTTSHDKSEALEYSPSTSSILAAIDVFALYNNDDGTRSRKPSQDLTTVGTSPDEPSSPATPFGYSSSESIVYQANEAEDESVSVQAIDKGRILQPTNHLSWLNETMERELTEAFFGDVYPNIPIIHKSRYYASLHSEPHLQPPFCLRYAMWALAALRHPHWAHLANSFYEEARRCLERDESRADEIDALTVAHVQCWSLIATYESYMLLSLRTWSSIRRAAALAHVLRLHTMDESSESANQLLPDSQDPSELEERRRAFWSAFSGDRWISSRTGYPMTLADTNITTRLPSSEQSFGTGLSEQTRSLDHALEFGLDSSTSLYGARVVLACVLGRVMRHVGSAVSFEKHDNGQRFWERHHKLDDLLSKIASSRPTNLRPSRSTTDPKLWALDMWIQGLVICVHQVAVDCAKKQKNEDQILASLRACRNAADHIINSLRSIAHLETRKMDPFTASCVYMAATVLIRGRSFGNSRITDIEDLRYLKQVLDILHKSWKVTEIFVTQFEKDLADSGISLSVTAQDKKERLTRKRVGSFNIKHTRSPSERTNTYISSD